MHTYGMEALYNHITIPEATKLQKELRDKVVLEKEAGFEITTVAGADISFNKFETTVYAGIVVLSFPQLQPIAYALVQSQITFPYVPGYLAFREVPPLLQAWELLPQKPSVMIIDGHGIAHPRRMGIAAHFGVLTGQPSLGCAKTILFGHYQPPENSRGAYSFIYNKDEVIGAALRTRPNVKPVFVSPGHKLSCMDSIDIIVQCMGKYRLPEPTRKAHELVNLFRQGKIKEGYHDLTI